MTAARDVLIARAVEYGLIPGAEYADALERVCEIADALSLSPTDQQWIRQLAIAEHVDPDEPYDDSQDHTRCPDCGGSGRYVGFREADTCQRCEGAGWV